MRSGWIASGASCLFLFLVSCSPVWCQVSYERGRRTVPDAHNCYPYGEWWADRIDRALRGGFPVAIEQDLVWYRPDPSQPGRSLVAHGKPLTGTEPDMEHYFFERVRPLVEAALHNPDHSKWPIITLNLDIKTEETDHLRATRKLLIAHESWLTTALRTKNASEIQPLKVGPVLVLNGLSDAQEKVFYGEIPVGGRLLTFGGVHTNLTDKAAAVETIETETATNYRRWWNNPWTVIEPEGQQNAGKWTSGKADRLKAFVAQAHVRGLWIRFYTLDGANKAQESANGWSRTYNFPSLEAAQVRWREALADHVDFLASDQYELVSKLTRHLK